MKILVIDDDSTCRTIVAIRLKSLGSIDVTEAEDGDKAWALLKRNHYDGAIVDWQMPGKSGLEVVREIRKAKFQRPILPGETVRLALKLSEKDGTIQALAHFSVIGQPAGEMILLLWRNQD